MYQMLVDQAHVASFAAVWLVAHKLLIFDPAKRRTGVPVIWQPEDCVCLVPNRCSESRITFASLDCDISLIEFSRYSGALKKRQIAVFIMSLDQTYVCRHDHFETLCQVVGCTDNNFKYHAWTSTRRLFSNLLKADTTSICGRKPN